MEDDAASEYNVNWELINRYLKDADDDPKLNVSHQSDHLTLLVDLSTFKYKPHLKNSIIEFIESQTACTYGSGPTSREYTITSTNFKYNITYLNRNLSLVLVIHLVLSLTANQQIINGNQNIFNSSVANYNDQSSYDISISDSYNQLVQNKTLSDEDLEQLTVYIKNLKFNNTTIDETNRILSMLKNYGPATASIISSIISIFSQV